jgi:uncharacterized protein (DUF1501 family)
VLVVQSEMGRTPNYNNGNGKDHWSIGSIMFLGPGIRGDRVIGGTDEGQFAVRVNPQTLELQPDGGLLLRPEHLHDALRRYAGIDGHPASQQFPLGIPVEQQLQGMLRGRA